MNQIIVLVEHLISLFLSITSIFLLLRILWGIAKIQIFKKNNQQNITNQNVSKVLLIKFVCWTLMGFTFIPHVAYMIFTWQPTIVSRDDCEAIFWTGIIPHCMMASLTVAVLFQILDRTFFITFPFSYDDAKQRNFFALSILASFIVFGLNFWDMASVLPLDEMTKVNSFSWLVERRTLRFLSLTRISGGFFILLCGCFLLYKIRKIQKLNKANKVIVISTVNQTTLKNNNFVLTVNQLIILQMCTELSLQFIPQTIAYLLLEICDIKLGKAVGSYNIFLTSLDMIVSSVIYYNRLGRFLRKKQPNLSNNHQNHNKHHGNTPALRAN